MSYRFNPIWSGRYGASDQDNQLALYLNYFDIFDPKFEGLNAFKTAEDEDPEILNEQEQVDQHRRDAQANRVAERQRIREQNALEVRMYMLANPQATKQMILAKFGSPNENTNDEPIDEKVLDSKETTTIMANGVRYVIDNPVGWTRQRLSYIIRQHNERVPPEAESLPVNEVRKQFRPDLVPDVRNSQPFPQEDKKIPVATENPDIKRSGRVEFYLGDDGHNHDGNDDDEDGSFLSEGDQADNQAETNLQIGGPMRKYTPSTTAGGESEYDFRLEDLNLDTQKPELPMDPSSVPAENNPDPPKNDSSDQQLNTILQQLDVYRADIAYRDDKLADKTQRISELEKLVDEISARKRDLENMNVDNLQRIANDQRYSEEIRNMMANTIASSERSEKERKEELSNMLEQIGSLKEKIDVFKADKEKETIARDSLKSSYDKLKEQLDSIREENKTLKSTVDKSESEKIANSKEREDLYTEITALKGRIEYLEDAKNRYLKTDLAQTDLPQTIDLPKLQATIDSLRESLQAKQEYADQMKSKLEESEKNNIRLTDMVSENEMNVSRANELEKSKAQLEYDIKQLSGLLYLTTEREKKRVKVIKELEQKLANVNKNIDALKKEKRYQSMSIDDLKSEKLRLEFEIGRQSNIYLFNREQQLAKVRATRQMKDELLEVTNRLAEAELAENNRSMEIEEMNEEIKKKDNELAKALAQIDEMKVELESNEQQKSQEKKKREELSKKLFRFLSRQKQKISETLRKKEELKRRIKKENESKSRLKREQAALNAEVLSLKQELANERQAIIQAEKRTQRNIEEKKMLEKALSNAQEELSFATSNNQVTDKRLLELSRDVTLLKNRLNEKNKEIMNEKTGLVIRDSLSSAPRTKSDGFKKNYLSRIQKAVQGNTSPYDAITFIGAAFPGDPLSFNFDSSLLVSRLAEEKRQYLDREKESARNREMYVLRMDLAEKKIKQANQRIAFHAAAAELSTKITTGKENPAPEKLSSLIDQFIDLDVYAKQEDYLALTSVAKLYERYNKEEANRLLDKISGSKAIYSAVVKKLPSEYTYKNLKSEEAFSQMEKQLREIMPEALINVNDGFLWRVAVAKGLAVGSFGFKPLSEAEQYLSGNPIVLSAISEISDKVNSGKTSASFNLQEKLKELGKVAGLSLLGLLREKNIYRWLTGLALFNIVRNIGVSKNAK